MMHELTIPQKSIADSENYSGELLGVIGGAFFIEGTLDKPAMNKALNLVVEHNDNYRIRFVYEQNEMKQYVTEYVPQQFDTISFASFEEYRKWIDVYSKTLIKKNDGIFEFIMIELPSAFGIVMRANHKVNDDIGMFLTKKQMTDYYNCIINNQPITFDDNATYINYINDEKKYISGKKFTADSEYWHDLINTHSTITKIAENDTTDISTARNIYEISDELQEKITNYCIASGVNEYNLLFSAFGLLMRRKLHKNDIYVVTTLSNRSTSSSKNTLGMYVDIIPVYINADPSQNISGYISSVGASIVSSIRHRRFGYSNVLKEAYNCGITDKISDVYFAYLNSDNRKEEGEILFETFHSGVQVESIHMIARVNTNRKLEFNYYYHKSQFSSEEIYLLNEQFNYILEKLMSTPDASVSDIIRLSDEEYSLTTVKFNNTALSYDRSMTVCDLLDAQVKRTPDKTAVIFKDQKLTYKELDQKADSLAHNLREKGVSRGISVAVISDRSMEMIIALTAVMKAGGNYVPISLDLPEKRVKYILDDCKPGIVLTHNIGYSDIFDGMTVIDLADETLYSGTYEKTECTASPDDLLYIIYTSGTTGNPKGVMLRHSSVVNFCLCGRGNVLYPAISGSMNRIACLTNISFDIFVTESWNALSNGLTVCIGDESEQLEPAAFSDFIKRNNIDVLQITPSRLKMLMLDSEYNDCFRQLKYIMIGAEKVTRSLINRLKEITDAAIADVYGPTETTVWSTYWVIDESYADDENLSVGRPITNTQVYIINNNELCGILEKGELCIAGNGLAAGYLNRPELTAEKFTPSITENGLMYHTGDIARWMPDGKLEFFGRNDDQLKIRGHRIELADIESVIRSAENISEAVVIARENSTGELVLNAYVVSNETVDIKSLAEHISKELPEYMIPPNIMQIDAIPFNSNGKLDKKMLPVIDNAEIIEYCPPRNAVDSVLIETFEEVLNVKGIGIKHGFFALGGDSLKATLAVLRMKEKGYKINASDILILDSIMNISDNIETDTVADNTAEKSDSDPVVISIDDTSEYEKIYPLTNVQQGIYYHCTQEHNEGSYIMQSLIKPGYMINPFHVMNALKLLVIKHEVLRTRIILNDDGEPVQAISRNTDIECNFVQASSEEELSALCEKETVRGFILDSEPLIRVSIAGMGADMYYIWTVHHIISDGWSNAVIFNDFNSIYSKLAAGCSVGDIKAEITTELSGKKCFSDYVSYICKKDASPAMEYWNDLLADYNGSCNIYSVEDIDSEENEGQYGSAEEALPAELSERLEKTSKKAGVSLNTLFESAIGLLLQRYMISNDIVFGKVSSGRDHDIDGIESMTGIFINTLPVRVTSASDMKLSELFSTVAKQSYTSEKYGICSIADIQNLTDQGRDLIKFLMAFENYYGNEAFSGENGNEFISSREQTNYDMTLIIKLEQGIKMQLMYAENRFCKKDAELFLQRAEKVLEAICDKTDGSCGDIAVYADNKEFSELWVPYNATVSDIPASSLQGLFAAQAKATPDNVAVICYEESITYSELYNKACSIAEYLISNGVEKNDRIAVLGERSISTIANMLGVLLAGCAYIPLNPEHPEERNRLITESSGCKMVLSSASAENVPAFTGKYELVTNNTDSVAYIIYTSGSTGTPKGVVIRQSAACNTIIDINRKYNIGQDDRILGLSSYCFDLSVYDIFGALSTGAALVIVKDQRDASDIKELITKHSITFWNSVPAIMTLFLDLTNGNFRNDTLRHVLFSGDWIPLDLPERTVQTFINTDITSLGGATEGSVWSIFYPVEKVDRRWRSIPYGKPLANQQMYVLDSELRCCSVGMIGQICIGGTGVAEEYFNSPEQTSRSFIMHDKLGRIYLTGDSGRMRGDGNIEFLGRLDDQVKIRGFRVELGEIENVLKNADGVQNAAVVVRAEKKGDNVLCAYLVSDNELDIPAVIAGIRDKLPDYMIPSRVMQIDEIPLTANGKLNKKALPVISSGTEKEYTAPRNENERLVCELFGNILGIEKVSVFDSFFDLGGHSLRAAKLINHIESNTGTRLSVKDILAAQTPEKIAILISGGSQSNTNTICKAAEKEYYPMSSAQKRLYVLHEMEPDSLTYNMSGSVTLQGKADPERVKAAMQKIIDRHEILRTQFITVNGEPMQKILDHTDAVVLYANDVDASEYAKDFIRPFDLSCPPLVRAAVVNSGDNSVIMLDMHHIIGDGMSMNILANEFMTIYNGGEPEPLQRQFKDYSEWLISRDLSSQKTFWREQFDEPAPVLDLITDKPRPQTRSYAGSVIKKDLGKDLSSNLTALSVSANATDYMIFLAAAMVMLSRYSRQEDIVIGSPVSGRTNSDTESMLGVFVNTLAMRGRPEKNKTFIDFLGEIKNTCLKAYDNQEYPFDELVELTASNHDTSRNPLFDVMLTMQNNEQLDLRFNGSSSLINEINNSIAKFDISFDIVFKNGSYEIALEYCTDLFFADTAERMLSNFEAVLRSAASDPEQLIGNIDMLSQAERDIILGDFNRTDSEYQKDKTVTELFEEQVRKAPDNTALVFEDQKLTYEELNRRANSLAHKLREIGVRPDDFVAIIAERSIEMICGIYGIIKSGGAYVPIDPTYPDERIKFMLEDSRPKAILMYTTESIALNNEIPVIDLANSGVWEGAPENLEVINKPEDLIYCIYTSGTTGNPKGVAIQNRSVINYLKTVNDHFFIHNGIIPLITNYAFDLTVTSILGSMLLSHTLVIFRNEFELAKYASKNEVAILKMTPSHLNILMDEIRQIGHCSIHALMIGGEALTRSLMDRIYEVIGPDTEIINEYGPTETTVASSYAKVKKNDVITIGKPFYNTQLYIVNDIDLCGIGIPGELCIAGDGLAKGYLNRPELTKEKFVNNPFGEGRMYRTGDLARWLPDGNIEYLGRIDEQVKIRGFRIELGEIENRIRDINGINDCAVIARTDNTDSKALYAYFTSDKEIGVSEIRGILSENLPEYMIPPYMMQIESIPVTKNGKLDKRALPEITAKAVNEYIAPQNKAEEAVCNAFRDILGMDKVGVKDDFFELGGDSIKAIRIISKLRNVGYTANVKDIMNGRTSEKIAAVIKISDTDRKYEQGEVTGRVESTPIIRAFGEWNLVKPEHYNQSMMFPVSGIDNSIIKQATEELVKHHDILRAVYRDNTLEILQIAESKLFDFYEFDFRNEADKKNAVAEKCTEIQESIDLANGPLVKIAVFELGNTKQMMFCIHHLAVDGVSWRILQEDFETAIEQLKVGKTVILPEKTASFIEWSRKLKEYGEKHRLSETEYWNKADLNIAEGLLPVKNTGKAVVTSAEFSKETTEILLSQSGNAYGAKTDEVLLAGLVRAVGRITGQRKVSVKLEGHGREELDEPVSTDRTVGWFTNVYAVSLEYSEDNAEAIINAKDTVRSVPNMGMGYGYTEHETEPDICFNYLGDFSGSKTSYLSEYSTGSDISKENDLKEKLIVNGQVSDGELRVFIITKLGKDFAESIKTELENSLEELAEYCTSNAEAKKTISDMEVNSLDIEELSFINSLIG